MSYKYLVLSLFGWSALSFAGGAAPPHGHSLYYQGGGGGYSGGIGFSGGMHPGGGGGTFMGMSSQQIHMAAPRDTPPPPPPPQAPIPPVSLPPTPSSVDSSHQREVAAQVERERVERIERERVERIERERIERVERERVQRIIEAKAAAHRSVLETQVQEARQTRDLLTAHFEENKARDAEYEIVRDREFAALKAGINERVSKTKSALESLRASLAGLERMDPPVQRDFIPDLVGAGIAAPVIQIAGGGAIVVEALCFPGETPICVEGGQSKRIDQIQIGDFVESYDVERRWSSCRRVDQLFENRSDHLTVLSFGGRTLQTTDHHPFYVPKTHQWVQAQHLRIGDELQTLSGKNVRIDSIGGKIGNFSVFNFEVEGTHTYFAGEALVHNCNLGAGVARGIGRTGAPEEGLVPQEPVAPPPPEPGILESAGVGRVTVDELVQNSQQLPGTRNHFLTQYQRRGTFEQAQNDFRNLANPNSIQPVRDRPEGWLRGEMPDGSRIMVRPDSTNGQPTIQIDRPNGYTIKFRYTQ